MAGITDASALNEAKSADECVQICEAADPGCGTGIQMADGGCNVTTCFNTAKHGGHYFYFCAHCKAECPDGESMCMSCPSHNDRQTRMRVKARKDQVRQAFLASNSADNPCEVDE